jgi:hypothetical protein
MSFRAGNSSLRGFLNEFFLRGLVGNRSGRSGEPKGEGQAVFPQGLAQEEVDSSIEVQPKFKEKRFCLGGQFRVEMESFRHGKLVVRVPEG